MTVATLASPGSHYENFPVASLLCPPRLRPAIRAIYAYARTADDIADEGDAPAAVRLADLAAYRVELAAAARGWAPSPRWAHVFGPLAEAIKRDALPLQPLADLLDAFTQDCTTNRYADRDALLDYCRRSADPVGRLLLHLHGIDDAASLKRSDAVCTALQLANFWQDLSVDIAHGRLYAPEADLRRHGIDAAALVAGTAEKRLVAALVADLAAWTRALMHAGAPLVHDVPGRAGWELRLVVQGGLRILDRVERLGAAALHERPTLGASDTLPVVWRACRMRATRPADHAGPA